MSYVAPTVSEFKAQFVRDFPYSNTPDKVMDSDIVTAQTQAGYVINPSLFDTQESFSFAYNYLAAHYLVMNIKTSSQGLGATYSWLESSKSVGSVSQSFAIPESILKNPLFAMLSKTPYGAYYLSLIVPLAVGQIFPIAGTTQS